MVPVNPSAACRHQPLDQHRNAIVVEDKIGDDEATVLFYDDRTGTIDKDVGNGVIDEEQ